jgi:arylsulfatase A-like enzyme/Flp pilus assembly protein TadD
MKKTTLVVCFSCFLLCLILYPTLLAPKSRPNVLLITIDTLRADRLSCYSPKHLQTPQIDRLASRGVLFTRAFAHTTTTLPSHTNILLGTTPLYHGVHENSHFIVLDDFLTLAEHLKKFGYATGAFIGAYPLDSRFGLNQGFDIYNDDYGRKSSTPFKESERRAEDVIGNSLDWLKKQTTPWFLWVHCYDPHDPYEPPEPFATRFKASPYDGEVAYVDSSLAKLLNYLQANNLYEQTIVVFTGDHGESLGEHGEQTHGYLAYNSTLWIPLIIAAPGFKPGRTDQLVGHIDLFPTICEICGIEKPAFLQGVSLVPALKGNRLPQRSLYFESLAPYYSRGWAPLRGYIQGRQKFIESPIPELYDLEKDFEEKQNLASNVKLDAFQRELERVIQTQSLGRTLSAGRTPDRETLERLKSLGYISSADVSKKNTYGPKDDVKVLLTYHNRCVQAANLFYKQGKFDESVELLKEVLKERADVSTAYTSLAAIYREREKTDEALSVLRQGLEAIPSDYDIFSAYVSYLYAAGRYEQIIDLISSSSLRQMEYDPEIWNYIGVAYLHRENFELARQAFEKSISIDAKFPIPFNNLGNLYMFLFRRTKERAAYEQALQNFQRAISLDPYYATAFHSLGVAFAQGGDLEQAILNMRKALELRPDFGEALYDLGIVYMTKGEKAKAYDYLNRVKTSSFYQELSAEDKRKLEALLQKVK